MYQKALSIYYSLAIFAVGAAAFVMYPSQIPEMTNMQAEVKHEFAKAWQQTIGDQPMFSEVALVYETIANFYDQASNSTIALLTQPETDEDIIYVFSQVYNHFAKVIEQGPELNEVILAKFELPTPENFMTGEPLYNIVPYRTVVKTIDVGQVAGETITTVSPVNSTGQPWVTVADNLTGQLYCLALYNGTVNKYLGPCKYDYD